MPPPSSTSSTDGTLMTHSRLLRMISKLKLPFAITHPTRDGENSMTVCHPRVMMLAFPFQAELIRTIGPGSRKRLISETGKSFLVYFFVWSVRQIVGRFDREDTPPSAVPTSRINSVSQDDALEIEMGQGIQQRLDEISPEPVGPASRHTLGANWQ